MTATFPVMTLKQLGSVTVPCTGQGEDMWPAVQLYVGDKCSLLPSSVTIASVQLEGGNSLSTAAASQTAVSDLAAQHAAIVVQLPEGALSPTEQALAEMRTALLALQGGLQELQRDYKQLQQDSKQLQQDSKQLQQDNKQLQQDSKQLQQDSKQLQQDSKQLRKDLNQSDSKWTQETGSLRGQLARLDSETKQLQRDVSELRSDKEQLRSDNKQLQKGLSDTQRDCEEMSKVLSKLDRSASALSVRALLDRVRELITGHELSDAEKTRWNSFVAAMTEAELEGWGLTRPQLEKTKYGQGTAQRQGSSAAHLLDKEVCAHAVTVLSDEFRSLFKFVFGQQPEECMFPVT